MKSIGLDIIENKRIKKLLHKNKNFINKVLTKNEIILLNKKNNKQEYINFLAGRWAVKEAIYKCLNLNMPFNAIDISYENEKPYALIIYDNSIKKIDNLLISISHENNYSVAIALKI